MSQDNNVNDLTTIGCLKETAYSFNDIKHIITEEIKVFHKKRIKKQDLTLQCLMECWNQSPENVRVSIIHKITKELKESS